MYLPDTARLTVVSCTPTAWATLLMVMGRKLGRTEIEEIALPFDNFSRDVQKCVLTLLNASDEEPSPANLLPQIVPHLAIRGRLRKHVLVTIADAQRGNLVVIERHCVSITVSLYDLHQEESFARLRRKMDAPAGAPTARWILRHPEHR